MDRHPGWTLLDDEDIARMVRTELELGDALRLVDTYFPGARQDFLGLSEPSIWLTVEQFFGPMLRPGAVLSHRWELVGREAEMATAEKLITGGDGTGVLVVGGGGTGKSRFLLALASTIERTHRTCSVRFLAPERELQARDLELLPTGPCIVVIDDGHDRPDVDDLIVAIARTRPDLSLIVASRPYGVDRIEPTMRALGLIRLGEPARIDLAPLRMEDLAKLATEVLAERGANTEAAETIALATLDSPLFTVIAAELVASGQADPRLLADDETARSFLLRSFRDALFGEVGVPYDRQALRQLLDLIALIQPINADESDFRDAAAHVLGLHTDEVVRHTRTLESAGLLLRRGRLLRIVPDLLADFLVADACLDLRSGSATGYADRVRTATGGRLAQHLIQNVAKLDWRVTRAKDVATRVLDQIWSDLSTEFLELRIVQRAALLRDLADISYYQPRRAIDLARILLVNPTDEPGDPLLLPRAIDYKYVTEEICRFVRGAGYHHEYLGEVADILWELGRDGEGLLHSRPENGVRILQDLASVEPNKPLAFTQAVIDRALVWLRQPGIGRFRHSPFDVLDVALKTEGHTMQTRGWTLGMTPFSINVDAVRDLRRRVLEAAIEELQNDDVHMATRAAATVEEGLRRPHGLFGQDLAAAQVEQWTPEIVWLLNRLAAAICDHTLEAVVQERVRRSIRWQAKRGPQEARAAATRVLSLLAQDDLKSRLAEALTYGWAHAANLLEDDEEYDYERSERRWRKVQRDVAVDFLTQYQDTSAALDVIEKTLSSLARAGSQVGATPGPFLSILFEHSSEVAEEAVERVLADPESPLREHLHLALLAVRSADSRKTIALAKRCLRVLEPVPFAIWVALTYSRVIRETTPEPEPEELRLLRELGRDPHEQVRLEVARGLRFGRAIDEFTRMDIIMGVEIDGSSQVADEIVGNFGPHGDFKVSDLSDTQRHYLIDQLFRCGDISGYQTGVFLADLALTQPLLVADLLTRRVDHSEAVREDLDRYQPVPFSWDEGSPIVTRNALDFGAVVRRILDWADAGQGGARAGFWSPHVFAALAGVPDEGVLAILDSWLAQGREQQLESAVHLLTQAPATLVWDHVEWVCRTLDYADSFGSDCYSKVASSLYSAVVSGGRSGTPGEPFPEDVEQRDRATTIARTLRPGSPGHRFFVTLAKAAADAIKWSIQRHEEHRLD